MAIPKSAKLASEEGCQYTEAKFVGIESTHNTGPLKIKPIRCLNDSIALLKRRLKTSIAMPENADMFAQEGIVVGIGPGLPCATGERVKTQLALGDVVLMTPKMPVAGEFLPEAGAYAGQKIVIVQERSLLCIMETKVEFTLDEDAKI